MLLSVMQQCAHCNAYGCIEHGLTLDGPNGLQVPVWLCRSAFSSPVKALPDLQLNYCYLNRALNPSFDRTYDSAPEALDWPLEDSY
eukprot:IDg14976t1